VMRIATVMSPRNRDDSRRLVTLGASTADTASCTKKSIRGGHTVGPSCNRRKA